MVSTLQPYSRRMPISLRTVTRALALTLVLALLGLLPAAASGSVCSGDCDASGDVTIDEVLRTLAVALGGAPISACAAAERNADGVVSVEEVVFSLQMALQGCPARNFQHGMNLASWWNGLFAAPESAAALDQLATTDVDTVVVVPTYYMDTSADSAIYAHPQKTESLAAIAGILSAARDRGFRTALKPHVDPFDGEWRGRIAPEDLDGWFASYTEHIAALARVANDAGCDLFVVASELQSLIGPEQRERWRGVIDAVRAVYGGEIAYAANWDGYERVSFWDMVDVVGIQAYFPLAAEADPSRETLLEAWLGDDGWMTGLLGWYTGTFVAGDKRLVFTEVGYLPTDFAARRPWEMEDDCFAASGERPYNGALQARAYAALLEASLALDGIYWWHWEPYAIADGDGRCRFTPQGKPAEEVLRAP